MKRLLKAVLMTAIILVAALLMDVASVFPHPYAIIAKIAVILIFMYLMGGFGRKREGGIKQ